MAGAKLIPSSSSPWVLYTIGCLTDIWSPDLLCRHPFPPALPALNGIQRPPLLLSSAGVFFFGCDGLKSYDSVFLAL